MVKERAGSSVRPLQLAYMIYGGRAAFERKTEIQAQMEADPTFDKCAFISPAIACFYVSTVLVVVRSLLLVLLLRFHNAAISPSVPKGVSLQIGNFSQCFAEDFCHPCAGQGRFYSRRACVPPTWVSKARLLEPCGCFVLHYFFSHLFLTKQLFYFLQGRPPVPQPHPALPSIGGEDGSFPQLVQVDGPHRPPGSFASPTYVILQMCLPKIDHTPCLFQIGVSISRP